MEIVLNTSNNKTPFGLKNGLLIDVSGVESGIACGCVCPSCHRKLQANKGRIVSHYFSHDPSDDNATCESAFETAIHLMAKQILSEEGSALFPELVVKVSQTDANGNLHEEKGLVEEKSLKIFDLVELEKNLDNIRPDIIAYQGSTPFLVEVAVTHFSDNEKIKLIKEKSISAIEIDLSGLSYTITKEKLRQLVINKVENKKWLANPAAIMMKQKLKAKLVEKIIDINKNIYRAREKQKTHYKPTVVIRENKYSPSSTHLSQIKTKVYDLRWFKCEACRHVFKVPIKDAPYIIDTVQCPECDYAVSTKSYWA